jgi:uncharacterized membrane protein YedE/YeeE
VHDFTPVSAAIGGALIGLAASLFLWSHGRVAGISGLLSGAILPDPDAGVRRTRRLFVLGLVLAGAGWRVVDPAVFGVARAATPTMLSMAIVGGVLVGFGTRLGSGCTSGHGVCGISRLSMRSVIATMVFMAVAIVTVYVTRHLGHLP